MRAIHGALFFGAMIISCGGEIVEYTVTGTQNGPLGALPASKRKINAHAVDIFHLKDGKLDRGWTYSNSLEIMTQLGLFQIPLQKVAPVAAPPPPKKK